MPLPMHTQWRDAKELAFLKIDVSSPSDEACKMYDATLSQLSSAYEDLSIGGLEGSLDKMMKADPDFVAGLALKLGITAQFGNKRSYNDPIMAAEAKRMMKLCEQPHVTQWEKTHARAINLYLNGQRDMAAKVYDDLLSEHPLDMAAIKFVTQMYVESSYYPELRDCCEKVLPYWKETTPFYGDYLSWYGFGLQETGNFEKAEKIAWKALDHNKNDSWAVHSIAHICATTGEFEKGSRLMEEKELDWKDSHYNCHNYWHWALFHYEAGDLEAARGLLDSQLLPLMRKYRSPFSVTDVASLIFRLEAEGSPVVGWEDCFDVSRDHLEDHAWPFSDVHVMMACAGAKRKTEADQFVKNVKDFISFGDGDNPRVNKEATLPILEAIQAYDTGDFDTAVELLKPYKDEIYKIGGSGAQRDVFNIFLIQAAIRSQNHHKFANQLIAERQARVGDTPLMKKMLQKLIVEH